MGVPLCDGGQKQRIRVVVRCRPPLEHEKPQAHQSLNVDPEGASITIASRGDGEKTLRQFFFDAVLDQGSKQQDVVASAGMDAMVEGVLAGYHGTVFAYGQTGSGKTHTMEGFSYSTIAPARIDSAPQSKDKDGDSITASEDLGCTAGTTSLPGNDTLPADKTLHSQTPGSLARHFETAGSKGKAGAPRALLNVPTEQLGLIPRSIALLFNKLEQRQRENPGAIMTVRCSYIQIYKEQVFDLLNPASCCDNGGNRKAAPQALKVRWSRQAEFYLENVSELSCQTAQQAMALFRTGVKNKVMASHRMNAASSRSHAIFSLTVHSASATSADDVTTSKLSLVDLAGCERSSQSGSTSSQLLKESIFINKSLMTLRKVITALSVAQYRGLHVPYRDSKLTALLKHALGGNSLTAMVACLAPGDAYWEDNLSTLEYASKAKAIENAVVVNENPTTRVIKQLRARVLFLEQQLAAVSIATPTPLLAQDTSAAAVQDGVEPSSSNQSATAGTSAPPPPPAGAPESSAPPELHTVSKKLVDSVEFIKRVMSSNDALRSAVGAERQRTEALEGQNGVLLAENAELRERLQVLEAVVVMDEPAGVGGGGGYRRCTQRAVRCSWNSWSCGERTSRCKRSSTAGSATPPSALAKSAPPRSTLTGPPPPWSVHTTLTLILLGLRTATPDCSLEARPTQKLPSQTCRGGCLKGGGVLTSASDLWGGGECLARCCR